MIDRVIEEVVGPASVLSRGFKAHLSLCALDEEIPPGESGEDLLQVEFRFD